MTASASYAAFLQQKQRAVVFRMKIDPKLRFGVRGVSTADLITKWRSDAERYRATVSDSGLWRGIAMGLETAAREFETIEATLLMRFCEAHQIPAENETCLCCEVVHLDDQLQDVATFVEHLRDGYQSTTMPVSKVARLIREHLETRNVANRKAPTPPPAVDDSKPTPPPPPSARSERERQLMKSPVTRRTLCMMVAELEEGKTAPITAFHEHLAVCAQCQEPPYALCQMGCDLWNVAVKSGL